MTYRELYEKAERKLEKGEITSGEFDEMTKPLDEEIRPHGEWERYGGKIEAFDISGHKTWGQKRKCTNCGFIKTYIEDFGLYSICPNCGADMRAGESNE